MLKSKILIALGCLFAATFTSEAQISNFSSGGGGFGGGRGGGGDMIVGAGYSLGMTSETYALGAEGSPYAYAGMTAGSKAFWYVQGGYRSSELAFITSTEINVAGVFNYCFVGSNSEDLSVYGYAGLGMAFISTEIETGNLFPEIPEIPEIPGMPEIPSVTAASDENKFNVPLGVGLRYKFSSNLGLFAEYDYSYFGQTEAIDVPSVPGIPDMSVESEMIFVSGIKIGIQMAL